MTLQYIATSWKNVVLSGTDLISGISGIAVADVLHKGLDKLFYPSTDEAGEHNVEELP